MKRLVAVLFLLIAVIGASTFSAQAAEGFVSKAEWTEIQAGMTKAEILQIAEGASGRLVDDSWYFSPGQPPEHCQTLNFTGWKEGRTEPVEIYRHILSMTFCRTGKNEVAQYKPWRLYAGVEIIYREVVHNGGLVWLRKN